MSAVLRVFGEEFEPDGFCATTTLQPCHLYRKGEPKFPASQPNGRHNDKSGINFVASEADFDEFPRQVEEATAFLLLHRQELSRLRDFPGVEDMTLDFGIARRDVLVQCDHLPPTLLRAAGELGIGIELSQYPVGRDDEDTAFDEPADVKPRD
ncbi:MAG: hypothetical protein NVSMB9_18930 [Isosphaeraceae bacterium]